MGASGGGDKCAGSPGHIQKCPAEAITQRVATSTLATCWELSALSIPSLPKPIQAPGDSKEVRWAHAAVWKVSALKER